MMRGLFAACVLLYLFSPSYPLQWVALFLATVILMGWLYRGIVLQNVSVRRRRSQITAFRHDSDTVEIIVENRSAFPIPFVAVADKIGNLYSPDEYAAILSLAPRERRVLRYRIKGHQRGRYRLGPLQLRSADPFGLFRVDRTVEEYAHVLIYPRIRRSLLAHASGVPAGNLLVRNPVYEDLTRFRSLRSYVPGDDPRRIHWKASARMGELQTIEYLPAIDVPMLIVLNLCAADYVQRHRYHAGERAVEVAASLANHAAEIRQSVGMVAAAKLDRDAPERRSGDRYRLILPIAPARGRAPELLSVLADVQLDSSYGQDSNRLLEQVRIPYRADVLYVGPAPPEGLRRSLQALSRSGRRVECYYLQEHAGSRPPEHEVGLGIHIVPEYGDWDVA